MSSRNTRAKFPQTIYAVAFMVQKTPGGPVEPAVETFDVSGENPLTAREATERAAAMMPNGWTWLSSAIGVVIQRVGSALEVGQ